jgi:hypothetical protein
MSSYSSYSKPCQCHFAQPNFTLIGAYYIYISERLGAYKMTTEIDLKKCLVCFRLPTNPMQCLKCEAIFCNACLRAYENSSGDSDCPLMCKANYIKPASLLVQADIERLRIQESEEITSAMDTDQKQYNNISRALVVFTLIEKKKRKIKEKLRRRLTQPEN